jgi:hypothetical protein
MKPQITDCPRTAFVEAGAELRPSPPFRSKQAIARLRRPKLRPNLRRRSPSSWHSESPIDTGNRSQKYIQTP